MENAPARPALFPEWPVLLAVTTWGSLPAVSGDALTRIEPAPLLTVALAVAALALAASELVRGARPALLLTPRPRDALLGLYGLGLFHVLLFLSYQRAPLIEVTLINDLWPLLTVLLAAPIVGEKLTWRPLTGAVLGLAGSITVVAGDLARTRPTLASFSGYALALSAALVWSSFTNFIKRWPLRPGALAVGSVLGALGCAVWTLLSGDPLPRGRDLFAAVYLGAFPLGVAVTCYEIGVNRGRVMVVGALSYLTPLLATLAVWLFLDRPLAPTAALGGVLILSGAVIATWRGRHG